MKELNDYFPQKLLDRLDSFCNTIFFVADYQEGHCYYMSKGMSHLLGHPPEIFLERGVSFFMSLVHPEDIYRVLQEKVAYFAHISSPDFDLSKAHVWETHYRMLHSNGTFTCIRFSAYNLEHLPNGAVRYFFGVMRDITPSKIGEEYLWRELQRRESSEKKLSEIKKEYERMCRQEVASQTPFEPMEIGFKTNPYHKLTIREKEVLKLISKGMITKEIADKMNISYHTAETYRKHLIEKFEVKNTAELIKEASKSYWFGT